MGACTIYVLHTAFGYPQTRPRRTKAPPSRLRLRVHFKSGNITFQSIAVALRITMVLSGVTQTMPTDTFWYMLECLYIINVFFIAQHHYSMDEGVCRQFPTLPLQIQPPLYQSWAHSDTVDLLHGEHEEHDQKYAQGVWSYVIN